jgi:uncharacterized damage-inducible protein DinB
MWRLIKSLHISYLPIMKQETDQLIYNLKEVLNGSPWYGSPVMKLLGGVDPFMVYKKPAGEAHSMIDLLYHMLNWTAFTVSRLERNETSDEEFENLDWRIIDPEKHVWDKGLAAFKSSNDRILEILGNEPDDFFLDGIVGARTYNFRYLLHGLIQHHIYHSGQIAYVNKLYLQTGK